MTTPAPESHNPTKTGIPNRRKTGLQTALSCNIDYFIQPNQASQSTVWPFFTGDYLV
jgi:hypothetical protein